MKKFYECRSCKALVKSTDTVCPACKTEHNDVKFVQINETEPFLFLCHEDGHVTAVSISRDMFNELKKRGVSTGS